VKLAVVSMVRNEADVIESFVRHHAAVVDEFLIADHRSEDGTGELLRALAGEGLPLRIYEERSLVQRQNDVLTGLMRRAARRAHWVLPLDADEFLVALGPEDARDVLSFLPQTRPISVLHRTYVPRSSDRHEGRASPLARITYRRRTEPFPWSKTIVPRSVALDTRFRLQQGNHALERASGRALPSTPEHRLALAHFPVRSPDQITRKVLTGWLAHCARPDMHEGQAYQWRRLYAELLNGHRPTRRRLRELAIAYPVREGAEDPDRRLVRDPVPVTFELRLEQPPPLPPEVAFARTAEGLARELGAALASRASAAR
jgi:hypothetical protein